MAQLSDDTSEPGTHSELGHFAPIHGLELYYELHGESKLTTRAALPLVLLPGGFMPVAAMTPILAPLAATRQVIAIEPQGHGHTADSARPMSFADLADDVSALLEHLGIPAVDVLGYSFGGLIAQNVAIRHPEQVRKLVILSSACRQDGWYPEVLAGMAAIQPENIPFAAPSVVVKVRDLLLTAYDWSAEFAGLQSPTMIAIGDADSIRASHALEMFAMRGGGQADGASKGRPLSQCTILPGADHFTILPHPALAGLVTTFLDGDATA